MTNPFSGFSRMNNSLWKKLEVEVLKICYELRTAVTPGIRCSELRIL